MKNVMTEEVKEFIKKLQTVASDLCDEYNELSQGMEYSCPLTETIDLLQDFSLMDIEDTIDENFSE